MHVVQLGVDKTITKLLSVLLVTIIAGVAMLVATSHAGYFTINSYHSDISIDQNSSFIVKETIQVTFHRPRHGIYRQIPFKYRNELGQVVKTPTNILSVTDESGRGLRYEVGRVGHMVHIRIGDPDRYVDGRKTYVINYRVQNAILFLDDHDELYWNVTGDDWEAAIEEVSADVRLVSETRSRELWAACYTGRRGSDESSCGYQAYENGAMFSAYRELGTGEGFTIAFGWDKGLVSPPSAFRRFLWAINLAENWVFLFPPLVFIFMILQWRKKGRDPKVRESIIVMYQPPEFDGRPLSAGEVGALVDERMDPRDMTSTILGLAVKGYIKIEEKREKGLIFEKTDYYIKKVKEPDSGLSEFEKDLMTSLIPGSSPGTLVSSLKNQFYTHLGSLKSTLFGELVRKKYFSRSPERVRNQYRAAALALVVLGGAALPFLFSVSPTRAIIATVLSGLPVIAFGQAMPAKTRAGASAYMDILGFQEFLMRAEKDRLERMGDGSLFSKFLPYAVALDVADNWASAFEGLYQDPPDWFVSTGGFRGFSPYAFTESINSVTSHLGSAMTSSPRGSGGGGMGGGGSSGGGFGGGGGGSW
jgi:uncharacterized membrane protein